jgi:hypothetical protein
VPVAHACNPSYSGGRDQEDYGQIVHETLSRKTFHKNRVGGVAKEKALSSSPSTTTTTKKSNPNFPGLRDLDRTTQIVFNVE